MKPTIDPIENIENFLSKVQVTLSPTQLDELHTRTLTWGMDYSQQIDYRLIRSQAIKEILSGTTIGGEPEDPTALYSWLRKKGSGMQEILSTFGFVYHACACLSDLISPQKQEEIYQHISKDLIEELKRNVELFRKNIVEPSQTFEDQLTVFCKNKLSQEFTNQLKTFLEKNAVNKNNFFLMSAEDKFELLKNLGNNEEHFNLSFASLYYTGHNDAVLFIRAALENKPDLMEKWCNSLPPINHFHKITPKIQEKVQCLRRSFKDNLTLFCKEEQLSEDFSNKLKKFLGDNAANNFFLKLPEERLAQLNNLRMNDDFMELLVNYMSNGNTALFLKSALNNDPYLIQVLRTNRLGQSFIPTEKIMSIIIAAFLKTEETAFTKAFASILLNRNVPHLFAYTLPEVRVKLSSYLLEDDASFACMMLHRKEAQTFLLRYLGANRLSLEHMQQSERGKLIMSPEEAQTAQRRSAFFTAAFPTAQSGEANPSAENQYPTRNAP